METDLTTRVPSSIQAFCRRFPSRSGHAFWLLVWGTRFTWHWIDQLQIFSHSPRYSSFILFVIAAWGSGGHLLGLIVTGIIRLVSQGTLRGESHPWEYRMQFVWLLTCLTGMVFAIGGSYSAQNWEFLFIPLITIPILVTGHVLILIISGIVMMIQYPEELQLSGVETLPALSTMEGDDLIGIPCPHCGEISKLGHRYCKECGRQFPDLPALSPVAGSKPVPGFFELTIRTETAFLGLILILLVFYWLIFEYPGPK